MKLRSKRRLILGCTALLLALFLIRPGATRLRTRIASSIGMALQRQVEISKVHVRLLPQPGFDLDGFVVHDDPAFGAEPVLRAPEVTALLRLTSLLRGRLEISRLSLSEPSLNLVRREDGRWNIENFLERTANIAVAPTGKSRSETRPAFPYIEADRGRINFKFGPEKKPFAVTDAKYAFWQESENMWGMRLKGQPVRTDFNLSDIGQVKVNGTWQRSGTLRETPVVFNLQWDRAQLGQFTKLLSGEDRGWRGTLRVSLDLVGTPANLTVRADGSLQDFRRYDIAQATPLDIKSHCEAHYAIADRSLRQILCQTPVGDGYFTIRGEASKLLGPRGYDVQVTAEAVPLNAVLAVIRRAKRDLPEDLRATGIVDARFNLSANARIPNSTLYGGSGRTSDFHLQSDAAKTDLVLDTVPFSLASPEQHSIKARTHHDLLSLHEPAEPRLSIGPFPLKLGRPSPTVVQGWITRLGYSISIKGDAEIQHLLRAARLSGIPAGHPRAIGSAKLDLQIAGQWSGFASPLATGSAELHSVQADIRGLNEPVEISSAQVNLNHNQMSIDGISASAAGTQWAGSLSVPRQCATPQACLLTFDLRTDEISTDQLNQWLNPNPPERPWYDFSSITPERSPSFLAGIRASGTLAANRVVVRDLVANRVVTKVDLDLGKLRLSDLRADAMGGKHRGEWHADFTVQPPLYSGAGTFDGISLTQLSDVMRDNWIGGTANAKYQVELAGYSFTELVTSARGDIRFEMRDGVLGHIVLATAPLRFREFKGLLAVHQGEAELMQGTLESPTASYAVSGKASTGRRLDFKLLPEGSPGLIVTGTLSDPRVVPIHRPETQAALKP